MTVSEYIERINQRYKSGRSTEHSYRGDLQQLLESLLPNRSITNEPKRFKVGAPDYIITNDGIPVSFIEAKDIGDPDLQGKSKHKEQFDRYKATQDPFIFTDYLDFYLYLDGDFITSIKIGEMENGDIIPHADNFEAFRDLIRDFATPRGQTIRSASKLSKMMAGKARLLSDVIERALLQDEETDGATEAANNSLREQLAAFQNVLIHDIDAEEFADIYAQTIAYGMFAARLHDPTLDTFSRHEAAELIPKTNPFLRKLFQYIAGYDLDDRLVWIVDALADIFRATDVAKLMEDFGQSTQQTDPIIHFYETFLAEFDPALRKSRGVWYTPEPVVNFIVRAVDDILKDEFGLKDGLADTSKTNVKLKTDVKDGRKKEGYKEEKREVHKVQILDPAAGTGTFLAEVIQQIYQQFEGQQGLWPSYVENHLIPRINGFELLMASYAMAHLKLDMLLRETGYDRESDQRFRVYLTNSLEEYHPDTGTLFANWLSEEANQANRVKRDTPVMVVMGNPPYSGESSNKGDWIMKLMEDYKKEPGGKKKLQEKNPKWINDDYVKFLRYGQHFVEKNGEGILAFINPHGFLDNPTFRGMRWNLLKTYDKIYTIDLHGNANKKETTPDGSKDENVFDIQQGVSINLFIKTEEKEESDLAQVYHSELYGKRKKKYSFLLDNGVNDIQYTKLENVSPYYFFTEKNYLIQKEYQKRFSVNDLFKLNSIGIVTARDSFTIKETPQMVKNTIQEFLSLEDEKARAKFDLGKDVRDWKVRYAKEDLKNSGPDFDRVKPILYRPFDIRHTYFTGNSKGFHCMPRGDVMQHFVKGKNIGLIVPKISKEDGCVYITRSIAGHKTASAYDSNSILPLYIYPGNDGQQTLDGRPKRRPNLDMEIVQEIASELALTFTPEKEKSDGTFAPVDLLDYIYAVLHSPTYREKYKEFLKIDFPRVPYPTDAKTFWQLVELGGELRQIHLLEHPVVDDFITTYPEAGSNEISYRLTKTQPGFIPLNDGNNEPVTTGPDHTYPNEPLGKVQINKKQYFGQVPQKAWNFYIGGYQPVEKWLKDRRDRELSVNDIKHYQKIIVALMETDRIMQEIDKIEID